MPPRPPSESASDHGVTLEDLSPGRCRLRMTSDSLDWPTMTLGRAAAEFEVVSPAELVDHLRERAELFGRAVGRHVRS